MRNVEDEIQEIKVMEICENCFYWSAKGIKSNGLRRCYANPPVPVYTENIITGVIYEYSQTLKDGYCRHWKISIK